MKTMRDLCFGVLLLATSAGYGFDMNSPSMDFNELRFTNKAQCALDSDYPTESAFMIIDGYNAGKAGYTLGKMVGHDSVSLSKEAMKRFRLSVTRASLLIIEKMISGKLPMLPMNIDKQTMELPIYGSLVTECKDQPYCRTLELYLNRLWQISNQTQMRSDLSAFSKVDQFQNKNFVPITSKKSIGCYYIKRFSALQGHLETPTLDASALTAIAEAVQKKEEFVAGCLDQSEALDNRSVAIQIDLLGGSESWNWYGFDFWNSFKIYLSWAWRNAPEMRAINGGFDNLFRSVALEESLMIVPNGCKSITIPSCDSEYVGAASIREFARKDNLPTQHNELVPQGPESHMQQNGSVDVNNDILNTRGYLSANDWVKNFRGNKDKAGFDIYRGHMKSRLMNATLLMDLLTNGIEVDGLLKDLDSVVSRGLESPQAKTEIYYLCTEFQLGASKKLDFLRSDIDAIKGFNFAGKIEQLSNKTVIDYYNYFSILAVGVLNRCDSIEKSNYWNVNYTIDKTGFQAWAQETLQIQTAKDEHGNVLPSTYTPFIAEQPYLVWAQNRGSNKENIICHSSSECARKVMQAMVDFYAVGTYSSAFIQSETKISSPGIFNPYGELKACKMYDPWFQTKRAWKMFALDLANTGAFGWNFLPFYVTGDIQPGHVTSFQRLADEGKITYAPNMVPEKFNPTLLADFGPLVGAPCSVVLSGDPANPAEMYAFSGISMNYCSSTQGHGGNVNRPNDIRDSSSTSRTICGGCYLNFSAVGAAGVALNFTVGFNPIKFGIYLFRSFERFFHNINDPVNVPRNFSVNVNYVFDAYREYGSIPEKCVKSLGEGLRCRPNICEARAEKAIENEFGPGSYIKSISVYTEGNSRYSQESEYQMIVKTPLCSGEIRVKFACSPEIRGAYRKEAQRGWGSCTELARQWSPWDKWRTR